MKIRSYMIAVTILLLTFSNAANKAIADLGQVEIDDLFYNSGAPSVNGEIEKFEFDQVDKILIKNEDLELESLEIADIDLATFGEYESFLNKYYDDNFIDIHSKTIKQIEIVSGGSFATKLPFGQNAVAQMENGLKLGFTFKTPYSINLLGKASSINLDCSFSSNNHQIYSNRRWNFIHLDTILKSNLYKNLYSELGFGIMSAEFSNDDTGSDSSVGFSLFFGMNYNIKILKNFTITMYGRAVLEKTIDEIPMYYADSTVEQLQFGISTSMPIYLTY